MHMKEKENIAALVSQVYCVKGQAEKLFDLVGQGHVEAMAVIIEYADALSKYETEHPDLYEQDETVVDWYLIIDYLADKLVEQYGELSADQATLLAVEEASATHTDGLN